VFQPNSNYVYRRIRNSGILTLLWIISVRPLHQLCLQEDKKFKHSYTIMNNFSETITPRWVGTTPAHWLAASTGKMTATDLCIWLAITATYFVRNGGIEVLSPHSSGSLLSCHSLLVYTVLWTYTSYLSANQELYLMPVPQGANMLKTLTKNKHWRERLGCRCNTVYWENLAGFLIWQFGSLGKNR